MHGKPCIVLLDNIDLSCSETQKTVFDATVRVFEKLNAYMKSVKMQNSYCVYFAMRPETYINSRDAKLGQVINFPLPNILRIALYILVEDSLSKAAKICDDNKKLKCNIEFTSIVTEEKILATTFKDVADYFNNILTHYLSGLWNGDIEERLGTNEEFHCNLVDCNVRRFLEFLAHTLENGGFKPLTKDFIKSPHRSYYTVYDYVEMIIRGAWKMHPGNKLIDGQGGNKAPIVFNVFDSTLWGKTQEKQIKNFMLYVRILQYLAFQIKGQSIPYGQMKNDLIVF